MKSIMDYVKKNKIFGVIRAEDRENAFRLAEACIEGGLKLVEITFTFPGAQMVIQELSKRSNIIVGAGTVLNIDMAKTAVASGARFIISPHTDREIISYAKSNELLVASGALTSSEILNAWNLGVDIIKIFPVKAVGGASYIKVIKETLPFIEIMTTGGVTVDNFTEFLKAGAAAVGLSSSLMVSGSLTDSKIISQRAKMVVQKLSELEEK